MHFVPLNFTNPGFNPAYTADFQLIIILNQDTFGYAVRHAVTKKLVRLSTGNQLAGLFKPRDQANELNSTYQKIIIGVETESFCLIPDAVFTTENMLDYAAFLSVKEADLILTDQIENGNNTVIFTFPEEIILQLQAQFNTTEIKFATKGWIKEVFEAPASGANLYLHLGENQLHILFPALDNIRFYNRFSCSTTDELVYYTALVAQQLKLKPEATSLIICGGTEANSEELQRLKAFFKEVSLFSTPNYEQPGNLPQHKLVGFLGLN